MTIAEGTRRVLVADDDSAIREMLSVNLEMLLTATAGDADVWRGWRAGADYCITKPFVLDELLRFIELLSEREAQLPA